MTVSTLSEDFTATANGNQAAIPNVNAARTAEVRTAPHAAASTNGRFSDAALRLSLPPEPRLWAVLDEGAAHSLDSGHWIQQEKPSETIRAILH